MTFIIILQLLPHYRIKSNWTDETNKILAGHWDHLVGLNQKGTIKLVARTNYDIDMQKIQASPSLKPLIWKKPPKYLIMTLVSYMAS
jgi:hypothetical protein